MKPLYIVELDFQNISKIFAETTIQKDHESVNIRLYIVVKKPCQALKYYPKHMKVPNFVRSPFKLEDDDFLNYWNLH